MFRQLVRLGEHTDDTRRRRTRAELIDNSDDPEAAAHVLDVFTEARLLTSTKDTIEITHDALLRTWPQLQTWINTDRADRLLSQDLHDNATAWQHAREDTALLYRGSRLHAAQSWTNRVPMDDITPTIAAFLTASIRQHRRRRWLRLGGIVTLTTTTIATVIAVMTAQSNARDARQQHALALSRMLAATSHTLNTKKPVEARQLAVAAVTIAPTVEAIDNLSDLIGQQQVGVLPGHTGRVNAAAFSPDGTTLATGSSDKTVRLWSITTRRLVGAPLTAHAEPVNAVAFSPDGTTLATGSSDKTVRLWNSTTHQLVGTLATDAPVISVAFSPDGTILATGSEERTARLWDTVTHQLVATLTSDAPVTSLAFSPDGTLATSGSNDFNGDRKKVVRFWNVTTHQPIGPPITDDGVFAKSCLAFNADGDELATCSRDSVRLWKTTTHEPLGTLPIDGLVGDVAFSPDGTTVAAGGINPRLWNTSTHEPIGTPFSGHRGRVNAMAFSLDGTILATGSDDNTVRLWNSTTYQPAGTLVATGSVTTLAFSPDGITLATGSTDKTVRLWNTTTHQPVSVLLIDAPVTDLAFSPDGTTLAVLSGLVGQSSAVQLWNTATHQPIGVLPSNDVITYLAFSQDGATLATANNGQGAENVVWLWNTYTRRNWSGH